MEGYKYDLRYVNLDLKFLFGRVTFLTLIRPGNCFTVRTALTFHCDSHGLGRCWGTDTILDEQLNVILSIPMAKTRLPIASYQASYFWL